MATLNTTYEGVPGDAAYQAISPVYAVATAATNVDPTYAGFDAGQPAPGPDATYSEVINAPVSAVSGIPLTLSHSAPSDSDEGEDYDC